LISPRIHGTSAVIVICVQIHFSKGIVLTNDVEIQNDTEVFDAMQFDMQAGETIWTRGVGTSAG
jgi:hypothetical protein